MIKEFQKQYRWLSNFAPCKVTLAGIEYPSVENAYQAAKTTPEHRAQFTNCTAAEAKKLGRRVPIQDDWLDVRLDVMASLLMQKFSTPKYKALLLATGNEEIQEGNWWNDTFWGVCLRSNTGNNHLGMLIMQIRGKLRT